MYTYIYKYIYIHIYIYIYRVWGIREWGGLALVDLVPPALPKVVLQNPRHNFRKNLLKSQNQFNYLFDGLFVVDSAIFFRCRNVLQHETNVTIARQRVFRGCASEPAPRFPRESALVRKHTHFCVLWSGSNSLIQPRHKSMLALDPLPRYSTLATRWRALQARRDQPEEAQLCLYLYLSIPIYTYLCISISIYIYVYIYIYMDVNLCKYVDASVANTTVFKSQWT